MGSLNISVSDEDPGREGVNSSLQVSDLVGGRPGSELGPLVPFTIRSAAFVTHTPYCSALSSDYSYVYFSGPPNYIPAPLAQNAPYIPCVLHSQTFSLFKCLLSSLDQEDLCGKHISPFP